MCLFAAAVGAEKALDPEDDLARRECRARALAALPRVRRKLTPREAEVVTRHYFDGEPLEDIGKALRILHPGVYRLHDRAIKRMGALMRLESVRELPPREDEL
jgi:RNA polymerase sigma factor FliA